MANEFDPDKYLEETSEFDPDAYLAEGEEERRLSPQSGLPLQEVEGLPDEIVGATTGALAGKALASPLEFIAEKAPGFAEKQAFRSVGGFDTPAGREFLKSQMQQLGLPEGTITPKTIGRLLLDEGELGTMGFRSPDEQFRSIDKKLLQDIERKQELLRQVGGTKDVMELQKRTMEGVGKLDPELSDIDRKISSTLQKDLDRLLGDKGAVARPRTAEQLEKLKTQMQSLQKYQAGRADIPSDIIGKQKARAAREMVEELVGEAGLGEEFTSTKADIGKRGILRDILMGKSIDEMRTPGIDVPMAAGIATGRPEIPAARMALQKGQGALARGAETAGKVLGSKLARSVMKGLPILGAFAGYQSARAAGLDPLEAAGETAAEEISELVVPGGIQSLGPREYLQRKMEMGERLTPEEYEQIKEQQRKAFKEHLVDKVKSPREAKSMVYDRMSQITPEETVELSEGLQSKYGDKASPFINALTKAAEADGPRKNALMYGIYQQPAFRKMLEGIGKESDNENSTNNDESPFSDLESLLKKKVNEVEEPRMSTVDVGRSPQGIAEIDEDFMEFAEGNETSGYIPTNKLGEAINTSGVTIAGGLDLGQRNTLDDIDLPLELKERLQPYLGKKREDAQRFLEQNPLEVSEEEAEVINKAVKDSYFKKTADEFKKHTGGDINELPAPIQTILYSLKYNTGAVGKDTSRLAAEGKYDELVNEVRNWHDKPPARPIQNRRNKEAEYLERQLEELRRFRENLR